jgi:transcriptional regulator with XRE-family HTH domain
VTDPGRPDSDNLLSRGIKVARIGGKRHGPAMSILAGRIRAFRHRRGLTLEALAAAAGIHKGHLSRIERGEKAPSVGTLEAIAQALGAQMAELFGESAGAADLVVVRREDRAVVQDPAYGVQALIPGADGRAGSLYIVEPGNAFLTQDRPSHAGQEIAYVLEGAVELAVADRLITLRAGDCATYAAGLPHRLRRLDGCKAAVLVFVAG